MSYETMTPSIAQAGKETEKMKNKGACQKTKVHVKLASRQIIIDEPVVWE